MARRGERLEVEHLLADDLHVLGRDRQERAPEAVEVLAVEAAGAALEALGLDQVRCADLTDVHREAGILADERSGRARVVEVDVGEHEVAQVPDLEPVLRQAGAERIQAARGPAVDQRGLVTRVEVRGDDTLATEMLEVEELHSAGRYLLDRERSLHAAFTMTGHGAVELVLAGLQGQRHRGGAFTDRLADLLDAVPLDLDVVRN